jgi:catechol 2,3-dioxygenase
MSTASAPIEIGHVALAVRNLPTVATFYREVLGLEDLGGEASTRRLGTGSRVLLELRGDPAARPSTRAEAGLFHTAFLLPSRQALARWLVHAATSGVSLQGAADHRVSEAIYLADPEGNGIEVYADRPRAGWHDTQGRIVMATDPLDLDALARAADARWTGAPEDTVIGHVHLQVGDLSAAGAFYGDLLGLPVTARYPGATFHGAGGYHHHVATNIWNSRGAKPRAFPATGLAELGLVADAPELADIRLRAGSSLLTDPWGTTITVAARPA